LNIQYAHDPRYLSNYSAAEVISWKHDSVFEQAPNSVKNIGTPSLCASSFLFSTFETWNALQTSFLARGGSPESQIFGSD
jgi:hypothetical protein